jgi:hypothetical protein
MTYAFSWSLQQALFAALRADPALAALIGDRVYDAVPHRATQSDAPYVLIGDEQVAAWSTASDTGAVHEIAISAVSMAPGFAVAKEVAAAICNALDGPITLARGRIVSTQFLGGRTRRGRRGELRRVDMRFRIAIEDAA